MLRNIIFLISVTFFAISIYSLTDVVGLYNTFFAIIGFIGSIVSIISYREQKRTNINKLDIFTSVALKQEHFTNRVNEIKQILDYLDKGTNIINVYGNKGVGKSEFLKIITDYINNNIKDTKLKSFFTHNNIKKEKYRKLKKYKVIYFDLSDKMGIKEIIEDIFSKVFPNITTNQPVSYIHFLNELEKSHADQNIIFIFDNFNNEALRAEFIKVIQSHKEQRNYDLFVIGSVNEFVSYTEKINYVEIEALHDLKVIKDFALKKGINLPDELISKLYSMSQGLPIFLNILLNNEFISANNRLLKLNIRQYLIEVVSKLDEETMQILKYCAFLGALNTTLKLNIFIELGFNSSQIKTHLEKLIQNSLLIDLSREHYKIHDTIADFIIENHIEHSKEVTTNLINYYKHKQQYKEVVIYCLLTNNFSDKKLIINTIKKEIDNDNLPYLFTLSELIKKYDYINNSFYTMDKEIYSYLVYSYLYLQMGIGAYIEAAELVDNLLKGKIQVIHIQKISSDIEFEFNYLVADLLHLQNQYTRAINDFRMLLNIANNNEQFRNKIPKCMWAIAHSGRHQAENLKAVLDDYHDCFISSSQVNDIKYMCRAINGKLCINLAFNNMKYNYLEEIDKVYGYADNYDLLNKIVLSTMKYHAIFLRKKLDFTSSKVFLDKAYKEHKKAGRRLVADLEFEYGEHFRKLEDYTLAYMHYKQAYDFGKNNNDRNLYTHSMLGIILVELISGKFFFHQSSNDIIQSLIENIKISSEANININKVQSKIILEYMKPNNQNNYSFDLYLKELNLNKEYDIYTNLCKEKLMEFDLIML